MSGLLTDPCSMKIFIASCINEEAVPLYHGLRVYLLNFLRNTHSNRKVLVDDISIVMTDDLVRSSDEGGREYHIHLHISLACSS